MAVATDTYTTLSLAELTDTLMYQISAIHAAAYKCFKRIQYQYKSNYGSHLCSGMSFNPVLFVCLDKLRLTVWNANCLAGKGVSQLVHPTMIRHWLIEVPNNTITIDQKSISHSVWSVRVLARIEKKRILKISSHPAAHRGETGRDENASMLDQLQTQHNAV